MYKTTTLTCLSTALLLILVGCLGPKTSGVWVEKGKLNIEDPVFASNIILLEDSLEMTAEGFLHGQVTIQNTSRKDFRLQYCFEWRGENGMIQKHAPAPWRSLVLHGREITEIDMVSPLQGSADFRLKLRREN